MMSSIVIFYAQSKSLCFVILLDHSYSLSFYHSSLSIVSFAELDIQDENGWTALHYGAMTNAVAAVRFLVEQGANKNLRDRNKRKPLHLAKFRNFGECIAVLASTTKVLV